MEPRLICAEEYARDYRPVTVFDSAAFVTLNAPKVDEVVFVGASGLALAIGRTMGHIWRAPFSAPYATPAVCVEEDIADYMTFAKTLREFSGKTGLKLVLPPPLYDVSERAWARALDSVGERVCTDLNFHIDLSHWDKVGMYLQGSARRNLRRALAAKFELRRTDDMSGVYSLIAEHHRQLGYHMAMTCDDVIQTAPVAHTEFFEVLYKGERVAAAIYDISAPGIAQLINWGDNLDLRHLRTSNFMAHSIFEHYATRGFSAVDLGPASTDGIPNEGLVRFKTALGAIETPKPTYLI